MPELEKILAAIKYSQQFGGTAAFVENIEEHMLRLNSIAEWSSVTSLPATGAELHEFHCCENGLPWHVNILVLGGAS